MAANVGRWFKYAQAKLEGALRSGHEELDELEAERAEAIADRPWLASDAEAPSFDEARARIEWEAEQQRLRAEGGDRAGSNEAPAPPAATRAEASSDADAEAAQARIELDRRAQASAERLDAIRRELGVDAPEDR